MALRNESANGSGNKTGNNTNNSATSETTTTTKMQEPAWNGNWWCIPETGRRCFNGPSDCAPWVACTENFYCVCHDWGCADSSGVCRPVHNQLSEPVVRLGPASLPNSFMTMPADGETNPSLVEGYPADEDAESLWQFLILPDNETVLITTRMNSHQMNEHHTAYASYLNVPPPPWTEHSLLTPIQNRPKNVLDAAWRLVERPKGPHGRRIAMQHILSERYLSFDESTAKLSSCAERHCASGSTDFNTWPYLNGIPVWPQGQKWAPKVTTQEVESWTPYEFEDKRLR